MKSQAEDATRRKWTEELLHRWNSSQLDGSKSFALPASANRPERSLFAMGRIFQPSYHGYQASPRSVGQALPISITGGGGSGPYSSAVAAAIENLQNELRVHEYEQALKTLQHSRSRGRALVKDRLQRSTAAAALSARGMSHYPPSVPYQQQGINRNQLSTPVQASNSLTFCQSLQMPASLAPLRPQQDAFLARASSSSDQTPQWVSAMIARNRLTASRSAAAGELSQKVTVKPKQKRRRVSDPFPVRLHRLLIAME